MAKLDFLVLHCTDTPEGRHITTKDIERWHMSPVEIGGRGWDRVGYSDMFYVDGSLHNLTPFNQDNNVDPWEMTFGAAGVNSRSRHVVYSGGRKKETVSDQSGQSAQSWIVGDTRNEKVKANMAIYCKYMILRHPDIKIAGHYHFAKKPCPGFDVEKWCKAVGIPDKNIYHGRQD